MPQSSFANLFIYRWSSRTLLKTFEETFGPDAKLERTTICIAYEITLRHDCHREYRKLFVIGTWDGNSFQRVSRGVFFCLVLRCRTECSQLRRLSWSP